MNTKKSYNLSPADINKIITVAYGDGNIIEKFSVWLLTRGNSSAKAIYGQYRRSALAARGMNIENLPEDVSIKFDYSIENNHPVDRSLLSDLYSLFIAKPVGTLVTSTLALLMIVMLLLIKIPTNGQFTDAEIKSADEQTRRTLMLVSAIFNKAESTVTNDILATRIGQPIKEGINLVNNLFKEGDKK